MRRGRNVPRPGMKFDSPEDFPAYRIIRRRFPMDTDQQVEEKIRSLIAEAVQGKFKKVSMTRETQLQKELGLDSIGILSAVFRFEEKFGVELGRLNLTIDVGKLRTVGDVIDMGREILKQSAALKTA
jgi:acyl carrier protein